MPSKRNIIANKFPTELNYIEIKEKSCDNTLDWKDNLVGC